MITIKKIILLGIIGISIAFIVFINDSNTYQNPENINQEHKNLHRIKNYSYSEDIRLDYKYSVSGVDGNNNEVYGKIDLEGQNGSGTLIRDPETKIEIVVENINNDKILAIDIDGNEYQLKIK